MYPPKFNRSNTTQISETVLIPATVMGETLYLSAYYQFSQEKWIICNFTGTTSIDVSSVKEWWPLPKLDSGIPTTASVIDKTVGMLRDSKYTKSLKPAIYSSNSESWFPINPTYYGVPPIIPYEWFPLPKEGTGIQITTEGEVNTGV